MVYVMKLHMVMVNIQEQNPSRIVDLILMEIIYVMIMKIGILVMVMVYGIKQEMMF